MTLYRYISSKADLMTLMDDAIMGESLIPDGELPAGWQDAVAAIARADPGLRCCGTRGRCRRCRAAARQASQGAFGPNGIRHFEQSLAAARRGAAGHHGQARPDHDRRRLRLRPRAARGRRAEPD